MEFSLEKFPSSNGNCFYKDKTASRMRRREICNNIGHGDVKKTCALWHTGSPLYGCFLLMIYRTDRLFVFVFTFVNVCLVTRAITVL